MEKISSGIKIGLSLLIVNGLLMLTAGKVDADHVYYTVTTDHYTILENDQEEEIRIAGFGSLLEPGKPKLPRRIFAVAIPPRTRMTAVTVEPLESVILDGTFRLAPAPLRRVIGREDPATLARQKEIMRRHHDSVYGSDDPYPAEAGVFVRTAAYRKYNLVDVSIHPLTYQPRSGKVTWHRRIQIKISYEENREGGHLPLSDFHPSTEKTAREIILNYEQAASWYPETREESGKDLKDFVLITPAALESAVSSLVAGEQEKGRSPEVVTVEWIDGQYSGTDQAARIRQFLREKYPTSEWGIRDVLIVGHHNEVAMRTGWVNLGYGRPRTDFYYAELSLPDEESWDLDGDGHYGEGSGDSIDFYAEVNVGRIPWSSASTVQSICDKSAAYEENADRSFKKNILLLGSYFWANTDNAVMMEAKVSPAWMEEWSITRMYEKNATVYSSYDCDYELNHSNAVSIWSGGRFAFVNWAGHGSPSSSHQMGNGGAAFIRSSDCASLNDSYPAIVFADACSNSDTDYDNIGRALLKRGAVGFVGATKVALGCPGWNDPSDGSSQSLDYYFTTNVTSGHYSQGEAHRRAMLTMYTGGLWDSVHYETYEWVLWGNPNLGLNCSGSAVPIPLVAAPGPWAHNPSDVRVFNVREERSDMADFQVYGADKFGANVAVGDLDDDGDGEIVTGPGTHANYGPHIRAFSLYGTPVNRISFLAYGTKRYGAGVACGDVDGDGFAEIITSPGPGSAFAPHVRGWNYDGAVLSPINALSFIAYGARRFGANVACGDLDGDGRAEILTGAGPGKGFGPHVRGWDFEHQTLSPMNRISFLAYQTRQYGVRVGSGDLTGDVNEEILTGPGPGAFYGAHVRAFSCETGSASLIPGAGFKAYADDKYGVVVSGGNTDDEGKDEILTGSGPGYGNFARIRGWRFDGGEVSLIPAIDFQAFASPDCRYGVNVAVHK